MNVLAKFIDIHRRVTVAYIVSVAPLGPSLILRDCNLGRKPPQALLGRRSAASYLADPNQFAVLAFSRKRLPRRSPKGRKTATKKLQYTDHPKVLFFRHPLQHASHRIRKFLVQFNY